LETQRVEFGELRSHWRKLIVALWRFLGGVIPEGATTMA
jgi:hypothetical protein